LQFLGFQNRYELVCLANAYHSLDRENRLPHRALPFSHSTNRFSLFLSSFWDFLFFNNRTLFGQVHAYLESQYLPLTTRRGDAISGSYLLALTKKGLAIAPLTKDTEENL